MTNLGKWRNVQFATLGGLHMFSFLMTAEQVTQLIETPWEILDNAILSSDRITEPSRKNSLRFPRSAHIQMTFLVNDL
jgi:hypothetical protein